MRQVTFREFNTLKKTCDKRRKVRTEEEVKRKN